MEDININLNVLKKSRKRLHPGDVFVYQPKNHPYYFGRVIRTDFNIGPINNQILIYAFNECSANKEYQPELNPKNLLLPPLGINRLPWSRGYFETLYNKELVENEILQTHCFLKLNCKYVDEYGNILEKPIEPVGSYGLSSYRSFDDKVSEKLGIPLAPD